MMKKSKSSYDLAARTDQKFKNPMTKYQNSVENLFVSSPSTPTKNISSSSNNNNRKKHDDAAKHKVVIYFSDAYNNICNKPNDNVSHNEIEKANQSKSTETNGKNSSFMTQLKSVLEEKSKFTNKFENSNSTEHIASTAALKLSLKNKFLPAKPEIPEKPSIVNRINQPANNTSHKQQQQQQNEEQKKTSPEEEVGNGNILPSYIESIDENNVIKLKIEQNFKKASELVDLISSLSSHSPNNGNSNNNNNKKKTKTQQSKSFANSNETSSIHELKFSNNNNDNDDDNDEISEPDEGYFYDWSFVQDWRRR